MVLLQGLLVDPSAHIHARAWVFSQNILLLALVLAGPAAGSPAGPWLHGWAPVFGGLLFALGAFLGVAGVRALGVNRTPSPAPLAEGVLVTTGIYAFVRHPLYASLIYAGFGWALIWSSVSALVLAVTVFLFLAAKAVLEERLLRDRFPSYAEYSRRVKRFLPGIY